jgi:hypothetical protein
MEAVMACWELEQSLQSLTGKSAFQLAIFNGEMRASLFWKRASSVHYHVCSVLLLIFSHHFLGNNEVNLKFFFHPDKTGTD